ncbi:hypothetical protein JOJ88_004741 [Pantoea cypripedii]|nr:hypothetical protein [Pantoea cypripedii]
MPILAFMSKIHRVLRITCKVILFISRYINLIRKKQYYFISYWPLAIN